MMERKYCRTEPRIILQSEKWLFLADSDSFGIRDG